MSNELITRRIVAIRESKDYEDTILLEFNAPIDFVVFDGNVISKKMAYLPFNEYIQKDIDIGELVVITLTIEHSPKGNRSQFTVNLHLDKYC